MTESPRPIPAFRITELAMSKTSPSGTRAKAQNSVLLFGGTVTGGNFTLAVRATRAPAGIAASTSSAATRADRGARDIERGQGTRGATSPPRSPSEGSPGGAQWLEVGPGPR